MTRALSKGVLAALRRAASLPLLVLPVLLSAPGCGGEETDPPATPTANGGSATPTAAPMEGRQVSRSGHLEGIWMRITAGELLGLEFLGDESAIVTPDRSGAMASVSMRFRVLPNGRLALESAGGATSIYTAVRDGDVLELTPESAAANAAGQRFQRLSRGVTLAEGLREFQQRLEAERTRRMEALGSRLAGRDLVLVPADAGSDRWLAAVRFGDGGNARLIVVPRPDQPGPLTPIRVHRGTLEIRPADPLTNELRLTIPLGPPEEPAESNDPGGTITLLATGPVEASVLRGPAAIDLARGGPATATLVADAALTAEADRLLSSQRAAERAAIVQMAEALGGRIEFRGERSGLSGSDRTPIELVLEVDDASPLQEAAAAGDGAVVRPGGGLVRFRGSAVLGNRRDVAAEAEIGLLLGAPVLRVQLDGGEQWRMALGTDGGFTGPWRPNPRADFISHGTIDLTIAGTETRAVIAAERVAIARFLEQDLLQPVRFTGLLERPDGRDLRRMPVWIELVSTADGSLSGQAWFASESGGVALSGRRSGRDLVLQGTRVLDGSADPRALANERWQLRLSGIDPVAELSGRATGVGRGGSVRLHAIDPATRDAERRSILADLTGPGFRVRNLSISGDPEPSVLRLSVGAEAGTADGEIFGGDLTGSTARAYPPGLVRGRLVEDRDQWLIELVIDGCVEPIRKRPSQQFTFTGRLARLDDGSIAFDAWSPAGVGNQQWLLMQPLGEERIEPSPEHRLRLRAQRLGAVIAAPAAPSIGDIVLMLVHATERDARVGQIFTDGTRFAHGNSIATAAVHAGLLAPGETGLIRVVYGTGFTDPLELIERNGVRSQRLARPNAAVPSFTIERLPEGP